MYRMDRENKMADVLRRAFEKKSTEKTVVGIDLTDEFSQVSYGGLTGELETLSLSAEEEKLCIPTLLAKKHGENIWLFGEEAYEAYEAGDAVLIDRLLARARAKAPVEVEMLDYDPIDLLALFIKKCLSRLSEVTPLERVISVTVTVDDPDTSAIEALDAAVDVLRIKREQVFFLSHAESAYHYMLHQDKSLRNGDMLICDLRPKGLHTMLMAKNIRTYPVVVIAGEKDHPEFLPEDFTDERSDIKKKEAKDKAFFDITGNVMGDRNVSVVYLLGEGFGGAWFPETLKNLCRRSRVFMGNNLYSKGACYGARERIEETNEEKGFVFLGKNKLKANLGMNIVREGENAYMALLDAGKNWYDSGKECDLILENDDPVEIVVTPLNGKNIRNVRIQLSGCPVRPPRTTRIHLDIRMTSEDMVKVCIADLGFGELYPSSGLVWESEFSIA